MGFKNTDCSNNGQRNGLNIKLVHTSIHPFIILVENVECPSTQCMQEIGFSAKYTSRLQLDSDLRLKLTKIKPDKSKLFSLKQALI